MRNLMEKQHSSWFALILTAFYSLLASCRGEECGHEELVRCARPLEKITHNNDLSFVTKKEELEELCPILQESTKCINLYTLKCLKDKQRKHFNSLYQGTNMAIKELCQAGPYQDAFLKHAPCMQEETVKREYEKCSATYQKGMLELQNVSLAGHGGPSSLKAICCSFQTYLECSHNAVLKQCGSKTAEFTKEFLDRMSISLKESTCKNYPLATCSSSNSSSSISLSSLMLPVLILLSRYFT